MTQQSIILPLGDALSLTTAGLHIHRELTLEEWSELLNYLHRFKHAYHCSLADVLNYGKRRFSEEAVNVAIQQAEFDFHDIAKAEAIGQLTLDFREKHRLTSEHYFILSPLDASAARRWAQLAEEKELTALELKRSIEAGHVVRSSEIQQNSGHGSGINTVQGAVFRLRSWESRMGGRDSILKLPSKEREQLIEILRPTIELAAALEESLRQ